MSWTDERVERLTILWNEGMSASQIAKELGGVTRNAVIGKVHRLGLTSRTSGTKVDVAAEAPKAEAPKASVREVPPAAEPAPEAAAAPQAAIPENSVPAMIPAAAVPAFQLPSENAVDIAEIDIQARKLSLMDLTERTCKWPIGDPSGAEFYFCGMPSQAGKPYCDGHAAAAYQPMSSRRDRERARQNRPAITRSA